jgi:hypothetical protein
MGNAGLGSPSPSATRAARGQLGNPHSAPWPPFPPALWNVAKARQINFIEQKMAANYYFGARLREPEAPRWPEMVGDDRNRASARAIAAS